MFSPQQWQLVQVTIGLVSKFFTLLYHEATSETPTLAEHYLFFRCLSLSSAGFPNQAPEAPGRADLPLFSPALWSHSSKLWVLTLQTCLFILPRGTSQGMITASCSYCLHVTLVFLFSLFSLPIPV